MSLHGQKQVHLAHGLGDNQFGWDALEMAFNNCNGISTTNETYTSTSGINFFQNESQTILNNSGSTNNDIMIGHSLGGIVARSLDAGGTNSIGGYMTVGSPHGGAQIANSVLDGKMENYLNDSCKEIVGDPTLAISLAAESSLILAPVISIVDFLNNATQIICDSFWDFGLQVAGLFGTAPIVDGQSMEDISVGGAGSNIAGGTLPSVAIRGEAQSPVHWNLLEDATGVDAEQIMTDVENELRLRGNVLLAVTALFPSKWYEPTTWILGGHYSGLFIISQEVTEAANWIAASEAGWNELIGAGGGGVWVIEQLEVPVTRSCTGDGGCPPYMQCINGQCVTMESPCDVSPPIQTEFIDKKRFIANPDLPSDGVVTMESQRLPGSLQEEDVPNVTHLGEQRSQGVFDAIERNIDPLTAPDFVFHIPGCNL